MLRITSDGGRTWGPRIDVADDPAGRDDQHDHATAAYTPDGRLIVAWRDRRNGGGAFGDNFDIWARELRPDARGTLHLGSVSRLTASPQPPTTGKRGGQGVPSEFIGLLATTQSVMMSWDQPAGSYPDNVFRRVPLAAAAPPARPAKRRDSHHERPHHRRHTRRPRHSPARFTG